MPRYIGQEIGGYRVMEAIGAGGMAKVYKAYQAAFDRFVALKILPETYAEDETYLKRFIQEAKIIARLEHKHILPVYDFGEDNKIAYLSMRYLQAGTLKDLIARAEDNKLLLGDTVRIIGQIAEALDYAHNQKIIHRDIKPSNILIDTHGDAFLMDFGIAKILDQTSHLTKTGGAIGTPAYMSPEQGSGKKVDGRSDVYSLGIILYQMMVGRVPFQADTPIAVMLAHHSEPLPIPSTLNPDIPEEIEKVILKALAKNPEDRFQSAGQMGFALRQAVGDADIKASTGILQLSGDLAVDMTPAEVTYDDRQLMKKLDRQAKMKKAMPWVLGVLVLGIIGTMGYMLSNNNNEVDFEQAAAIVQEVTETAEAEINATQTQARTYIQATATQLMAKRNLTQTVVALTPSATPTITPTPLPNSLCGGEGDVVYYEDFEDGIAQGWHSNVSDELLSFMQVGEDSSGNLAMRVGTQEGQVHPTVIYDYLPQYFRMEYDVQVNKNDTVYVFPDSVEIGGIHSSGHVVIVRDNYAIEVYLDGVSVETSTDRPQSGKLFIETFTQDPKWVDNIVICELPAPITKAVEGDVLFEEDFEDGVANGLSLNVGIGTGKWEIIQDEDGNSVLMGLADEPDERYNIAEINSGINLDGRGYYSTRFRVMLIQYSASTPPFALHISSSGQRCSHIEISFSDGRAHVGEAVGAVEDGTDCNWSAGVESDVEIDIGVWYDVRVDFFEDNIRVYVDDELLIDMLSEIIDPAKGITGSFNLVVTGVETIVYYDDIRVIELLSPDSSSSRPDTPSVDTSEIGGLNLNGFGNSAKILYDESLKLDDGITIEAWIYIDEFPPCQPFGWAGNACNYMSILSQGYSGSTAGNYTFAVGPEGLLFAFESIDSRLMGSVEIPENEWIHVAVSHRWGNGNLARFYLNGEPLKNTKWVNDNDQAISGNSFPEPNSGADYYIGAYGVSGGHTFNGVIDELRIWQTVRSQDEIQSTMGVELSGSETGLVAYWNFNLPSETEEIPDLSGNTNHAGLLGSAGLTTGFDFSDSSEFDAETSGEAAYLPPDEVIVLSADTKTYWVGWFEYSCSPANDPSCFPSQSDQLADVFYGKSVQVRGPDANPDIEQIYVRYQIRYDQPVRIDRIDFVFAALANHTVNIYDGDGNYVGGVGPINWGDNRYESSVSFGDLVGTEFEIEIIDGNTVWTYIESIQIVASPLP